MGVGSSSANPPTNVWSMVEWGWPTLSHGGGAGVSPSGSWVGWWAAMGSVRGCVWWGNVGPSNARPAHVTAWFEDTPG